MHLLDILSSLFDAIGVDEDDDLQDPGATRVEAVLGDQIASKVEGTKLWHHAIYIGKVKGLRMVVEMTGKTGEDTPAISLRPLQDLGPYFVVKYPDDQSTEEALKASMRRAKTQPSFHTT